MLISPIGRGILAAIALLVAIVWMAWARAHPPRSIDRVTGTVIEVIDTELGSSSSPIVRVRLDDGREARVMIGQVAARPGQRLPFRVESYSGSEVWVSFDTEQWIDSAGVPAGTSAVAP